MLLAKHKASVKEATQEKQRQRDSEAQKRQVERDCPRPKQLNDDRYRQAVNIAVAGASGQGESSLIRALLGLGPTDHTGPEVGALGEVTRVMQPHSSEQFPALNDELLNLGP